MGDIMKKLCVILFLGLLLLGCANVSATTGKRASKKHKATVVTSVTNVNNTTVENNAVNNTTTASNVSYYFARVTPNVDQQLISVINSSKSTLDIAIYSLTKKTIVDAIIAAKNRGINVEIITDNVESQSKAEKVELAVLKGDNIPIKINTHSGLMHLKMTVTDDTVTTGSYNYTEEATKDNDEVLVIIKDIATAKEWKTEFENMWNDDTNYANY
jgi:phosphatidylserine/phosphatidylglycerophosphate/cardiolipin synthase-like enzyme